MKFAIGYSLHPDMDSFFEAMASQLPHIAEVYFPWPGMASGRSALGEHGGFTDYRAQGKLEDDLYAFRKAGVQLDLLFNGNCYGAAALSEALSHQVHSVIDYIEHILGLPEIVTTTSPAIAHVLKRDYPPIKVRASVNMRIGTVLGMEYMASLFDEFVMQRDYNRDFKQIETLLDWAKANGKGLTMLANSGCMRFCSGQSFHDNLVSHGGEVDQMKNMDDFQAHTCWRYLSGGREHWPVVLQSTWVRPEDIHRYEAFFPVVKLATRMHPAPWIVLEAYARGAWGGNLLDLFEPGFGAAFAPYIVDNSKIPADWFDHALACDKQCHRCTRCRDALEAALVKL